LTDGGDITIERPLEGLFVAQPRRGFRYGSEAFWLVGFALEAGLPDTAVDLGTGSGIMACLLTRLRVQTMGVDLRSEWAPCWDVTRRDSRGLERLTLMQADVASFVSETRVDLVVSNPPFFPKDSGPVSPDGWKAAARTESTAPLSVFIEAALRTICPTGRVCFVVPQERADEVVHARAFVSRRVDVGKRRTLVELRPGEGRASMVERVAEDCPRVSAWYAAALGRDESS